MSKKVVEYREGGYEDSEIAMFSPELIKAIEAVNALEATLYPTRSFIGKGKMKARKGKESKTEYNGEARKVDTPIRNAQERVR